MRRDFDQVATNSMEILESPLTILPGVQPVFSVTIPGDQTIDEDATLTMKLYKGSKDVTLSNLSGSMSVRDRTITLKKIVSLSPGDWVFYIYYTDGGVLTSRFCRFSVPKEGA